MWNSKGLWTSIALAMLGAAGCGDDDSNACNTSSSTGSGLLGGGAGSADTSDPDCDTAASGAYGQAADALAKAACDCLGMGVDDCTGSTREQRECSYALADKATGDLAEYRDCAVGAMRKATNCIQAASSCNGQVLADCGGNGDEFDPIASECGAEPAEISQMVAMCEDGTANPGGDGDATGPGDTEDPSTPGGPGNTEDPSTPGGPGNTEDPSTPGGPGNTEDPSTGETIACNDGTIIQVSWVCDGEADCPGGEDEVGCDAVLCDDGMTPILREWICDGEADCPGGEDEADC